MRLAVFCLIGFAAPLSAQTAATPPAREEAPVLPPPTLTAARTETTVRIDGRLDEPAWAAATPGAGFRQTDPAEGQPPTHPTEVRVLYDDDALYIGARMFDSEPLRIRAHLGRRDETLPGSDLLEVYIDSYHNRVSGYLFRVTPAGAVRDAAIAPSGFQDNSWDAVWESATAIDSLGWTAEFRIPFSQLRYAPRAGDHTFGINFRRTVRRTGENTEYSFTPRRMASGPQRWGTLAGLTGLPRTRHLELMPYATSRAEYLNVTPGHPFRGESEYRFKAGIDLKYGLTTGLTLSGAVNPDFGQVEVDPARVNLTANELFFPERRPFFVEGADIFRYGQIRANNQGPSIATLFHSRRIGRAPQRRIDFQYPFADMPEEATIGAAVKISGEPRPGLSVGFLDAVTMRETARYEDGAGERGSEAVEPRTNYLVNRVRQDFRSGSTQIGALVTAVNRDLSDEPLAQILRRDAYFVGVDLNHSWKQRMYALDAAFGRSAVFGSASAITATQRSPLRYFQRPDLEADHLDPNRTSLYGNAWQLSVAKTAGRRVVGNLTFKSVTPGFEVNDVGFQSQASYRVISQGGGIKQDQPGRIFRDWFVGPFSTRRWNFDGDVIHSNIGLFASARLLNYWNGFVNFGYDPQFVDDRLTRGGPAALKPPMYWGGFGVFSDQRKVYTISANYWSTSSELGGWEHSIWSSFGVRPNPALRVSVSPQVSFSHHAAQFLRSSADSTATGTFGRRYVFGSLRYNQLSLETRVDWTFSPTLSLQLFAQPLVATGEYRSFKSLRRARTFDFDTFRESDGTLTRDENGYVARPPGGPALTIGRPDFTTLFLVGNAVVRWEYRPGSALFFVWQQRRSGGGSTSGFVPGRNLGEIFGEPPENVFAIKATYWIAR